MFAAGISLAVSLLLLPWQSLAVSSTGSSVLVVLEPKLKREDFSLFFNGLERRGFNLTFKSPKDVAPAASQFDVPAFNHVILFAPTTKSLSQDLSSQSIVSLLSAEPPVNFLIALSPTSTQLSILASEFSLSLPPPNTPLLSHFPPRDTPHTIVPINLPARPPPFINPTLAPILFSGVPHFYGDSPLLVPALHAPAESFATDTEQDKSGDTLVEASEKGGEGLWAGSKLGLVTGFQTKTGARVMWAGGVSLFSDEFARTQISPGKGTGNLQFAKDISAWAFQESLVLRIDHATHYLADDRNKTRRDHYTTNDQIVFTIRVSAFDPKTGEWNPPPRIEDLQLAFTMLDPHILTTLYPVAGRKGEYSVAFRVPDRHGVFKFVIDHRRKGYTSLHYTETVPIVPPRHDGYPRFLSSAWPYYAGAISTSVGFLVFSVIWLGGEVDRKAKGKGKGKKAE